MKVKWKQKHASFDIKLKVNQLNLQIIIYKFLLIF